MNIIKCNIYANCVAYSFCQCYDSSIEVLADIKSDEEHLQMLKALVQEYEMALEIVEDEATLYHTIDKDIIQKVKNAKTLEEAYK